MQIPGGDGAGLVQGPGNVHAEHQHLRPEEGSEESALPPNPHPTSHPTHQTHPHTRHAVWVQQLCLLGRMRLPRCCRQNAANVVRPCSRLSPSRVHRCDCVSSVSLLLLPPPSTGRPVRHSMLPQGARADSGLPAPHRQPTERQEPQRSVVWPHPHDRGVQIGREPHPSVHQGASHLPLPVGFLVWSGFTGWLVVWCGVVWSGLAWWPSCYAQCLHPRWIPFEVAVKVA
jgi:hypothetical protein